MFEFATRWLVCLVLLAVVVQSERTIKNTVDNLFEERQAMLVWLFVNVCLVVCTAVVIGWKFAILREKKPILGAWNVEMCLK